MNARFSFIIRVLVTCGFIFAISGPVPAGAFASFQLQLIHFPGPGLQAVLVNPPNPATTTEGGGTAIISVSLDIAPVEGTDVTIPVSSTDETEGTVDVAELVFTPADLGPKNITVTGQEDLLVDGSISYSISLGAATSDDPAYSGVDPADVPLTNLDNDPGVIVDDGGGVATSEAGPGTDTFSVVLTTEPVVDVAINVTSLDTGEGIVSPASLTFAADVNGNWATPHTVTVTGVEDFIDDDGATFTVQLAMTLSGEPDYDAIDPDDVTVTNQDDDTAGILLSPDTGLLTSEAGGNATFDVSLTSEPTSNVTLALSSSDPSEGNVSPLTMTFTPGDWFTPQPATVAGSDDPNIDGDIDYQIDVAVSHTTDPIYAGIAPVFASVTNQDDDAAGILITDAEGLITKEDKTPATFNVLLDTQPIHNVSFNLESSDLTEGTVSPESLTFTPSNWSQAQEVTVAGVNDNLADGSIAYTVLTHPATSQDGNYDNLDPQDVPVVNADDDKAGVTISPGTGLVTTEGHGAATISLVLNTEPAANVVFTLSSRDPGEGGFGQECRDPSATLTFSPSNWAAIQSVVLCGVDDWRVDGDVPYKIQVSAQSNDPKYDDNNVPVLLHAINKDAPTIRWVKPANHDPWYETSSRDPILLGVAPVSGEPISYVRFYRWDPELQKNVDLFNDESAPYQFYLDPQELDIGFNKMNQIWAFAVDHDGDPTQSVHVRLLIFRLAELYLPMMKN